LVVAGREVQEAPLAQVAHLVLTPYLAQLPPQVVAVVQKALHQPLV
jgi:hypothetical protein